MEGGSNKTETDQDKEKKSYAGIQEAEFVVSILLNNRCIIYYYKIVINTRIVYIQTIFGYHEYFFEKVILMAADKNLC